MLSKTVIVELSFPGTVDTSAKFTDEFKQEAVSLLGASGRPLTQVAVELGVQPPMLRQLAGWVARGTGSSTPASGTGRAAGAASAEQAEILSAAAEGVGSGSDGARHFKRMARPVRKQFLAI